MNKITIFFSLLLVLNLSCRKGDDTLYLATKDNLIAEFTIPVGLNNLETHYFKIKNVDLFLKETLAANNLLGDNYKISGSKARLVNRLGQIDLSSMAEVTVDAVSINDASQRRELFYQTDIPFAFRNELKLFTSLTEISDLLVDDKINLEVGIRFRSFSSIPVDLDLEFGYVVFE